jgi:hypothetical protein
VVRLLALRRMEPACRAAPGGQDVVRRARVWGWRVTAARVVRPGAVFRGGAAAWPAGGQDLWPAGVSAAKGRLRETGGAAQPEYHREQPERTPLPVPEDLPARHRGGRGLAEPGGHAGRGAILDGRG